MRKVFSLAAMMVLALVSQGLISTPAQAVPTLMGCTGSSCGDPAGFALWNADGDSLQICDMKPDGMSVVVLATINGVAKPAKWHYLGSKDVFCSFRSYGNVAEHQTIRFYVCLGDYSDQAVYEWTCGYQVQGTT
jgi:hypothetical protein